MTLEEIKYFFAVDLTQDNRNRIFVILKNIYVNQGRLKGCLLKDIADELNMTVSSVTLCYQRTNKFKTYFNYTNIQKAFDNKDQELFALEKQLYDNRALQINKNVYIPTVTKRTRDKELVNFLDMIPHPKRRWHYTNIIETLKKDNKNKLWDKPMPNFTFRDYEVLKNL
jgi:hypothetical protein